MNIVCDNCGRDFSSKQNLQNHLAKNACKELNFFCTHCGKGFACDSSVYRHIRTSCKVKKKEDEEKKEIYDKLVRLEENNKKEKEDFQKKIREEFEKKISTSKEKQDKKYQLVIKKLENKIKVMEKKIGKGTKIINNNSTDNSVVNNTNTNNGVVANIILVGYGKEDMSKINKNDILKTIGFGFNSTLKLTKEIHFNPKYPEYHNIYISNNKDKYAMMYDGYQWNLRTKEDVINMIYDDKKNYIEENLEDFVNSLSVSKRNALQRWLDTEENDQKILRIKEEMRLLLYNNRHVTLNTISAINGKNNNMLKDESKTVVNIVDDLPKVKKKKVIKKIKDNK